MSGPLIGGAPAVTLRTDRPPGRPGIVEATVLPGRGFMLLQAVAALADGQRLELIEAPEPEAAAKRLDGGPDDFAGNQSFAFGGAILAPFANRITGRPVEGARAIAADIGGRVVRLPRNWGGRAPGAQSYAMHGLILSSPATQIGAGEDWVSGPLPSLGDRWPGQLELHVRWNLEAGGLRLQLTARNAGAEPTPFGAGWHPYFRLPSGDRAQARLHLPAGRRAEVNNYDDVLPTGRLLDVEATPYDFRAGRALGALYLDDCFTGLPAGACEVSLLDPAGGLGLRLATRSPPVRAVQVFAPPDRPVVVIEPQFNLGDPFSPVWEGAQDTGMIPLQPGAEVRYEVFLTVFDPGRNRED